MVKRLSLSRLALPHAWPVAGALALALVGCDTPGGGNGGKVPVDGSNTATSGGDTATATASDALGDTSVSEPGDTTATSGDSGSPPADTATGPDISLPTTVVAPSCVDGQLDETLPNDGANIDPLISAYSEANYRDFVFDVLAARYPLGHDLVADAVESSGFGDCIDQFTDDHRTAGAMIEQLSTVVHECGHIYDLSQAGFSGSVYKINDARTYACSSAAARQGKTFARSLINGDAYASLYPGDFYKQVYLNGDPENAAFEGGDQGFDSVLEETTQYVNSLATDWAFRDQRHGSVSARDGILTFLWYLERYLQMARLEFPSTYSLITSNQCWREATLSVWGRAWLYLDVSEGEGSLGIDDATLEELVLDPDLLGEIALLRNAAGCE